MRHEPTCPAVASDMSDMGPCLCSHIRQKKSKKTSSTSVLLTVRAVKGGRIKKPADSEDSCVCVECGWAGPVHDLIPTPYNSREPEGRCPECYYMAHSE